MIKIVKADKDAYITNKVISGERKINSNTGGSGTLDLFKLYGATFSGSSPNTELSRILIHFDISEVKTLVNQGKIDFSDSSFWCKMYLKDVYGGQTTPSNFDVSVFPLSASFSEGVGKDITYFSDYDRCNWSSSSIESMWYTPGCDLDVNSNSLGDYITSSLSLASTEARQTFIDGSEDLVVDITAVMSATLAGELPDSGFRISFKKSIEDNEQTYFVKRFASRSAYSESKRPKLVFGFDDSISDDTQNLTFDTDCKINLYNYSAGSLTNITSGSSFVPVVGNNCLLLRLLTEISGGNYVAQVSGSQFTQGIHPVTGVYTATVNLSSNAPDIKAKLLQSGSIEFTPVWSSIDKSVGYVTGSKVYFQKQDRKSARDIKKFIVTITDIKDTYFGDEEEYVRVNIFDESNPKIKLSRLPIESPRSVIRDVFYQIRDAISDEIVVPFDEADRSTKISSDSLGMFFKLDTSNLSQGRTYKIDVMISHSGTKSVFRDVSSVFKIEKRLNA